MMYCELFFAVVGSVWFENIFTLSSEGRSSLQYMIMSKELIFGAQSVQMTMFGKKEIVYTHERILSQKKTDML